MFEERQDPVSVEAHHGRWRVSSRASPSAASPAYLLL